MKKLRKSFIIICSLVLIFSVAGASLFIANAINDNSTEDTATQENIDVQTDDVIQQQIEYDNKKLEERDTNDLLALTILRKYQKTDATEIIDDKQTDLDLMSVICDMIEEGNLPTDEERVLRDYLERRVSMLDVPTDSPVLEGEIELRERIISIIY